MVGDAPVRPMQDQLGRGIDYLRISVTDRCNLRCVYCMPAAGVSLLPREEILTYEEITRIARVAVSLGVRKLRLTGGEPLARPQLVRLVQALAAIPGVGDLAMTTNGTLLARHAASLADAGLKRVNVSLDSLRPERFHRISRVGNLSDAMAGIAAAEAAGLLPIKLNVVVVRGWNEDEAVDFARLTLEHAWWVRFIEVMPLGEAAALLQGRYVSSLETRLAIERELGPLASEGVQEGGPARYWRLPGAPGRLGFISPISEHFCATCNRLRLTADGHILPCLLNETGLDVRGPLRQGIDDQELAEVLRQAVRSKPSGHHLQERQVLAEKHMSGIGG